MYSSYQSTRPKVLPNFLVQSLFRMHDAKDTECCELDLNWACTEMSHRSGFSIRCSRLVAGNSGDSGVCTTSILCKVSTLEVLWIGRYLGPAFGSLCRYLLGTFRSQPLSLPTYTTLSKQAWLSNPCQTPHLLRFLFRQPCPFPSHLAPPSAPASLFTCCGRDGRATAS